jgi:hypothetical protein
MPNDNRVTLGPDGTVIEASPGALSLLEMSLEQLQALPPGGLGLERDAEASKAFESAWTQAGRADIVGAGTIRLPDGRLIRVRYLISPLPDGGFAVLLDRTADPVDAPAELYTASGVLSAWRATERRLAEVAPDSSDWQAAQEALGHFRAEYRRLVAQKMPPPDGRGSPSTSRG